MMKKAIALLLLAAMLLSSIGVLAEDSTNGLPTGSIAGSTVSVRNQPYDAADIVGTLSPGTPVIITAQLTGWYQVFARAERMVGWVPSSYVAFDNNNVLIYTGVVISQNVSLRESPSTGAKRIASIPNGSVFDLLDEQNGWYYVRYWDGKSMTPLEGWVIVDYVVRDPSFVTTTKATYVYATPTFGSKKVGQLISGTQLVVIGEWGDFWVVNLRSASGFIAKRDIEVYWMQGGNG